MEAEKVYQRLNELSIPYEILEHEVALTVEEMEKVLPETDAQICKNLFLRNEKGNRHYLVVMAKEKHFMLKKFGTIQGLGKMSFASEKRLLKYLGVPGGSVSPFGLLNDSESHVVVYVDKALKECSKIGVHPNVNNATAVISEADFEKFMESLNNEVLWVEI